MCWDADWPSACSTVMRKARKTHHCDECGLTILPGVIYEYTSGVWDGEPSSFKICEACQILREHVLAEDCNEYPPFGMLIESAREIATDGNPDLWEAYEERAAAEKKETA